MERVAKCVHKLPKLFKAKDQEELGKIAKEISKLEHEADLSKNDIRRSLKGHLFLPVARLRLLEVLTLQDALADKAEDIAVLCTFCKLTPPPFLKESFDSFLKKNLQAFDAAREIIVDLTEILESTFGGVEAEKLRRMVEKVALLEHEVDLIQRELLKQLYANEDRFTYATFGLWMKIVEAVGDLSDLAEKLANSILITMETK